MATIIPKLITDTDKYFQYEGSANPTTQDELQAYMKNEHSIVECLTDMLWQPSTSYNIGHVLRSPNMPKGFQAVALVTGTTGANEPDWGDGSTDITDGSMKWKVTTANITVNGISPDASGNIPITVANLGILDWVYPVGSLYWSKKSTSPATLFGGTWTQIKDKFILAAGDIYGVGTSGGEASHNLTVDEMPSHNHSARADNTGAHSHVITTGYYENGSSGYLIRGNSGLTYTNNVSINSAGAHSHTITVDNAGEGTAHNNMPPYVTYYCWERTA